MSISSRDLVIHDSHDQFSWVMLLEASSRRELSRKVKERNWYNGTGCGADCTGRVFSGSCELLRAYRDHGQPESWVGVVYCTENRDV